MIALNILLGLIAAVLLCGIITDNEKNLTIAFVTVVALIIAANTIM